jgi:pyrroloquinoline quinone (PQQ) biosynthesis protein C
MTQQLQLQVRIPGADAFRARLLSVMDRKDHPSYWRLMGPGATRQQLFAHYLQEWKVYVRDFPVFLSRVHARCPDSEVRQELAENLYEEETGGISGGGPHGELFLHMMEGLGYDRARFDRGRLLPTSRAYRDFLDRATQRAPWIEGLAIATIFVEGSRNDRKEISGAAAPSEPLETDPLVVNHGLDPRFLRLKQVHRKVEGGHRLSAWRAVLTHATTPRERERVLAAMERALALWLAYRDGVARAAKLV